MTPAFFRASPLAVLVLAGACTPVPVTVEVLPPRTSTLCTAPDANSAALGRGLLDLDAQDEFNGAYTADLRVTAPGQNAHIDSVAARYTLGDDELGDFDGVLLSGDVVLVGSGDDNRRAVVENVELVSRALAEELRTLVTLEPNERATLGVELTPEIANNDSGLLGGSVSTFALDLCQGCLVGEPDLEECPGGFARRATCRPGQDVDIYTCVAPTQGGIP